MTPEIVLKLHLSAALLIFLAGFGVILLRTRIFGSLVGASLCLKVVFLAAFIIARYQGDMLHVMTVLSFSALTLLVLTTLTGLALGLRSLRFGGPLDLDKESELKN